MNEKAPGSTDDMLQILWLVADPAISIIVKPFERFAPSSQTH